MNIHEARNTALETKRAYKYGTGDAPSADIRAQACEVLTANAKNTPNASISAKDRRLANHCG